MSYLSTASPAGCSQERVMDVGDWEGEVKLVGDLGTSIIVVGVTGVAVGVAVNDVVAAVEVVQC